MMWCSMEFVVHWFRLSSLHQTSLTAPSIQPCLCVQRTFAVIERSNPNPNCDGALLRQIMRISTGAIPHGQHDDIRQASVNGSAAQEGFAGPGLKS